MDALYSIKEDIANPLCKTDIDPNDEISSLVIDSIGYGLLTSFLVLALGVIASYFMSAMYGVISFSLFSSIGYVNDNIKYLSIILYSSSMVFFVLYRGVAPALLKDIINEKRGGFEKWKESKEVLVSEELEAENCKVLFSNQANKAIILWDCYPSSMPIYTEVDESNLLGVEVFVDDVEISHTKTNVGSVVSGAAIGGVITGGVGAVVGAIANKKETTSSESMISEVSIKVNLKSGSQKNVVIYKKTRDDKGVKKDSFLFNKYVEDSHRCHMLFLKILNNGGGYKN